MRAAGGAPWRGAAPHGPRPQRDCTGCAVGSLQLVSALLDMTCDQARGALASCRGSTKTTPHTTNDQNAANFEFLPFCDLRSGVSGDACGRKRHGTSALFRDGGLGCATNCKSRAEPPEREPARGTARPASLDASSHRTPPSRSGLPLFAVCHGRPPVSSPGPSSTARHYELRARRAAYFALPARTLAFVRHKYRTSEGKSRPK